MNTTGGKTDETFIRTHTDGGPKPTGQSGLPHGRALAVLRRIARPTIRSGPPVRLGRRHGPPNRSRSPDPRYPVDPLRVPQFPHGDDRPSDQLVLLGDRILPVVLRRGHAVRHRRRPRGHRRMAGPPLVDLPPRRRRDRRRQCGQHGPRSGRANVGCPRALPQLRPPEPGVRPVLHGLPAARVTGPQRRFGTYLSRRRSSRGPMGLVTRFARQWVAGETLADAIRVAKEANARGLDALVNHLGEHYREKAPVESTRREYLSLLATMQSEGVRGEVSIKPTQFGVLIDRAYALSEMIPILEATKALGRVLWLDMESAHTTDDTIWIGERLLDQYDRVGLCLLAHLETLFTKGQDFAVASHDGRMIERALALAKVHPTPFEFAMLQGVRDPLKIELVRSGHRVAEYIPYGPNWLPYFTRRLRERPRNVITMIRSFVSG